MYMKINWVNSNCRSKRGMGVYAEDRSGGVPTAASSSRGGLGGGNSGVVPLLAGGAATPNASSERTKSHAGGPATIKMLKMKVDPEMYMKTQDRMTQ